MHSPSPLPGSTVNTATCHRAQRGGLGMRLSHAPSLVFGCNPKIHYEGQAKTNLLGFLLTTY